MDQFIKVLLVLNDLNLNNKKNHKTIKKLISNFNIDLGELKFNTLIEVNLNMEILYLLSIEYFKQGYLDQSLNLLIFIEQKIYNFDNISAQDLKFRVNSSISTIYLIKLSNYEIDENEKNNILKNLKNYLNKSDFIDMNEKINFITKGFYSLVNNNLNLAKDYFYNARENDENYLPSLICLAIIKFIEKNWGEMLIIIKKCLKLYHKEYPELRLVLFICYFNLNDYSNALLALESYEKINNKNDLLYIYYAIIYFKLKDYEKYFMNLEISFKLNQNNPLTTYYLSLTYIYKGDFQRAKILIIKGISNIKNYLNIENMDKNYNELKSRYFYLLGLINQINYNDEGSLEKAYNFYNKSIIFYPNYDSYFNLAKLYCYNKKHDISLKFWDKIKMNNFYEINRFKAYLYLKVSNKKLAIQNYEKILKYYKNDIYVYIELAEVKEQNFESDDSNLYYKKALELIKNKNNNKLNNILFDDLESNINLIEVSILNNLAINNISKEVIYKEKIEISYLNEALDKLTIMDLTDEERVSIKTILLYNSSIHYEKIKNYDKCVEIHEEILAENPGFIESLMRLSWIEYKKNNMDKAMKLIDESIEVCRYSKNCNRIDYPISLKAYMFYDKNDFFKALEILNQLKNYKIVDTYCNILKAGIFYKLADYYKKKPDDVKKYIGKSAILCYDILKHREEKNNYYAAQISSFIFYLANRKSDCNLILSNIKLNNHNYNLIKLNLAYLESKKSNYEKSNIILKNIKSNKKNLEKIYILSSINNIYLNKFELASKNLKLLIRRNPGWISYFNFSTYIYEKSQIILKNSKKLVENLNSLLFEINISLKNFKIINKYLSIDNNLFKYINDSHTINYHGKRYFSIKSSIEKEILHIEQNINEFKKIIEEEKQKIQIQKASKNDRKAILDNKLKEKNKKQEEDEIYQKNWKLRMEKLAEESLAKAQQIKEKMLANTVEDKPEKKKLKQSKWKLKTKLKKRDTFIDDKDDEEILLNKYEEEDDEESKSMDMDDIKNFDDNNIDQDIDDDNDDKEYYINNLDDKIEEKVEEKIVVKKKKINIDDDDDEEMF